MIKKILLSLIGLLIFSAPAFAGEDRRGTTDPTYIEGGNVWRIRHVKMSTNVAVILSSAPTDAGLGISMWRKRFVMNASTSSVLGIYPEGHGNTTYDWSNGVTLASATVANVVRTLGNTEPIDHQGLVEGIWKDNQGSADSPATIAAKKGALVFEQYYKR